MEGLAKALKDGDSSLLGLVKEMAAKRPSEEARSMKARELLKEVFTPGMRVVYQYESSDTPAFRGEVVKLNESNCGFYPAWRYPVIVKRDDGHVFEYDAFNLVPEVDYEQGVRGITDNELIENLKALQ